MDASACPQIYPISDLRTNLNAICDIAEETREPIFMTKNGKPELVVINSQAYDDMLQRNRMMQKIREAEIEAKYHPEAVSLADSRKRVEALLAQMGV